MEIIKPAPLNPSVSASEPLITSSLSTPSQDLKSEMEKRDLPPEMLQKVVRRLAKEADRKQTRVMITPIPGFVWNPLLKTPRNSPCPCGSEKKFKRCCMNKLPRVVPSAEALEQAKQELRTAREGY